MASVGRNLTFQGGVKGVLDPFNLFHGKKKSAAPSTYQFTPYAGARPPAPEYLRPTEKQLYEMLSERSKGIGVGFDPKRSQLMTELVKSQLGAQTEDDVRAAQGSLSAAGLSGNPRAIEATTGRVRRDATRTMGDELSKIAIEDLTRANDERDINTQRFQNFNNTNFAQANNVANFDADIYGTEQGLQRQSSVDALTQGNYEQNRGDDRMNDLVGLGLAGADLYLTSQGAPPGTASSVAALAGRQSGTGIAPQTINTTSGVGYRNTSPIITRNRRNTQR